jgi:[protein-PII] uridylyltransferase
MTLLEKIEADAAARLRLPTGRTAAQELARFKTFLKLETHRLKMLHRGGGGGLEVCRARAAIFDVMLRHLWDAARQELSPQAQKEFPPMALVAIGGYGRAELNPHSDIDVMFLHAGQVVAGSKPLPHLSRIIDGILYPLWDLGLKIGHSVRTVDDCVKVANSDMQSKTSLIEARLIIGDAKLFEKFEKTLVAKCVAGHEREYIAARLADQAARRAKFGNSACMQEPNLKNGCGALRDFQNLIWMAFFKYRTRALWDLEMKELITPAERKQLKTAYDFLLRVRTELHYHVNRPVEVLAKALQPAVAHNLGYTERSPGRRIERFMRDVYTHSRNIYLITRTLEQRLALLPLPPGRLSSWRAFLPRRRAKLAEPVDGFRFENGQIHAASARVFRDDPRRLMRVFLHAQQRGLQLHPDLAQHLRNQLALVDRAFLADAHVAETFLTLLGERGNVAPILRAMHEVDLLGKYLPEFGKLTCLVQHEFYHQYTADEHTLVCIEQLDRVWEAKQPPHEHYTTLFQNLEQPHLLYLALLLHDTGKAFGSSGHAAVGGALAQRVARRLRLPAQAADTLHRLVNHHLLMSQVSQRRDLEDAAVIRRFAGHVESLETLNLLTLLTFVDAQATSDKLWNGFKDALLRTLHAKTRPVLTGAAEFVRAGERQRGALMEAVRKALPDEIHEDELQGHFDTLPARYFQAQDVPEIVEDLRLVNLFLRRQQLEENHALEPVLGWQDEADRGCTRLKVCTWDRAGLFSHIAGALSATGLNILTARIFTRDDGIALDTFHVNDARTGVLANDEQREKFEVLLAKELTGGAVDFRALIARQKMTRPLYQSYEGEPLPTHVRFDSDASDHRTLIEVETEDRIGLLHVISQTLSGLHLDISAARICTERGAAIDSFYVSEADGGQVLDAGRHKLIERRLRHAIESLGRD